MKNKYLLPVLLGLLFISNIFAQKSNLIHCIHPQVCRLLLSSIPDVKFEEIRFGRMSDHSFQMTAAQMKKTFKAKILIIPPAKLFNWIPKLVKTRESQKGLRTIVLNSIIDTKMDIKHNHGEEALGHFWLDPESECENINLIQQQFNIEMIVNPCNEINQIDKDWKKAAKKDLIDSLFLITHDALTPFFEKLSIQHLALKGSGHHEPITPSQMKRIIRKIKSHKGKIIWIEEKGIKVPASMKKYIKKSDLLIKWDPEVIVPHPLETLLEEVKK
ncbi:MAG: zinc ABC transporter substrate-binding protein [Oligoflexia bacterium]|nr:zinc ABC transporter substrate-binding protein [Oligoflexia bacterium]